MIVGNGLIANAFRARFGDDRAVTVFASGVSNSSETAEEPFLRERLLLQEALDAATGTFVYFSTCSLTDPDRRATPYVEHKRKIESLLLDRDDALVLRLPQIVGRTPNPHTLTNFLAAKIQSGERFTVWSKAIRSLIDVFDVADIAGAAIDAGLKRRTIDIAPPGTLTMMELVKTMERVLGRNGNYELVERGGGSAPDAALAAELAQRLGIDFSDGYAERVLRKYYGEQR